MATQRTHRARSQDGTEIGGRVQGEGPPVVFVHGGLGDDQSWRFMLPFLEARFTCYTMSTRGRGLSADNHDHSWDRIVEDVQAFAESVGGPVGLVGHSSGGALALETAARSDAVSALALFEPTLFDVGADVRDSERDERGFARMAQLAEQRQLADAAQVFLKEIAQANDEELEAVSAAGGHEVMAPNVPPALHDEVPHLSDPAVLERLTMPVLLLDGTRTHAFYATVAERLAERLPDPQIRHLEGLGHLGPMLAPEPIAAEVANFFGAAPAAG